jgi:hypothetical protein
LVVFLEQWVWLRKTVFIMVQAEGNSRKHHFMIVVILMISVGREKKWVIKYRDRKMILSSISSMRDNFSKIVVNELNILFALILYDAHPQKIMRKMIKVYHPPEGVILLAVMVKHYKIGRYCGMYMMVKHG